MKRKRGYDAPSPGQAAPAGRAAAAAGPARAGAAAARPVWPAAWRAVPAGRGARGRAARRVFFPVPGPASGQPSRRPATGAASRPPARERWVSSLSGRGAGGRAGTVPLSGQAYVAVGGGVAAVGAGLTVTGYGLRDGESLWQITLNEPAGSSIMSVRAWPGVVTAGIVPKGGRTRTEVVIDAATGTVLRRYPAAVFGGTVAASAATTVVVGPASVTSYDNSDGRVRWRRPTGVGQTWRADDDILYVAESAGGYLGLPRSRACGS